MASICSCGFLVEHRDNLELSNDLRLDKYLFIPSILDDFVPASYCVPYHASATFHRDDTADPMH